MGNIYHILHHPPAVEREEMTVGLEALAHRIITSGLLRIDAFDQCNFVRLYRPFEGINLTITHRQLYHPELVPKLERLIREALSGYHHGHALDNLVTHEIARLKAELKRALPISRELELKIARLVVQTNHPVIMELALLENIEIYVSYSYNIGDVLDVITYQHAGQNGGMQSTDGRNAAIFISCGGDPFGEIETPESTYGNGMPALARLLVIGGQESGHYADIIRDSNLIHISRHSANIYATRAKEKCRLARLKDIEKTKEIEKKLNLLGLVKLIAWENRVKLHKKYKRLDPISTLERMMLPIVKLLFCLRLKYAGMSFYRDLPKSSYLANQIHQFIKDQKFNIAPKADVYRNDNKTIEEAIACVEALARVPQQVNKWGHDAVRYFWPDLYSLYYKDVIQSCISSFELMTKSKFSCSMNSQKSSLKYRLKNLFKKKPYPANHMINFEIK